MRKFGNTNETLARQELQEAIEVLEEKGFDQNSFEFFRSEYAKLPRRAPRKKVKINFDANKLPKVTKRPLDHLESAALIYLRDTFDGEK